MKYQNQRGGRIVLADIKVSKNKEIRNFGYYLERNWNACVKRKTRSRIDLLFFVQQSLLFTVLSFFSKQVAQ